MTFTGTLADINAALDGLSFSPTADYNGAASLQITTNDQGNTGSGGRSRDTDTVTITVNRGQRRAAINTSGRSANYIEDTPTIVIPLCNGNLISISDVDAATVTITGNFVAGQTAALH